MSKYDDSSDSERSPLPRLKQLDSLRIHKKLKDAKERLIVGDSEQSVLARLQSEGWNVKQSKFILGQSKP